jgi:hypothetical protein
MRNNYVLAHLPQHAQALGSLTNGLELGSLLREA